jgi:hypothetical protein
VLSVADLAGFGNTKGSETQEANGGPMKSHRRWSSFLAVLGVLVASSAARASAINPGITVVASDELTSSAFLPSTNIYEWVVSGNQTNSQDLSFIFQVQVPNQNALGNVITGFNSASYFTFTYNVAQTNTDTSGELTGGISSGNDLAAGSITNGSAVVSFSFNPPNIAPGSNSDFLVINTNATTYGPGAAGLQDDITFQGTMLSPAGSPNFVTPEPNSAILCIGCFLCVGGAGTWRRWRRRNLQIA